MNIANTKMLASAIGLRGPLGGKNGEERQNPRSESRALFLWLRLLSRSPLDENRIEFLLTVNALLDQEGIHCRDGRHEAFFSR